MLAEFLDEADTQIESCSTFAVYYGSEHCRYVKVDAQKMTMDAQAEFFLVRNVCCVGGKDEW